MPMETKWTDALLEPMRAVDDPPADAVIEAVVRADGDAGLAAALRSLVQNDEVIPGELPQAVRDYFAQTAALPAWADRSRIAQGEQIFVEHGPVIGSILVCASLPYCYACAQGVNVLHISMQLSQFAERRIIETARFLFDVMTPGGLAEGGLGVRAAQKIRVLHSTMRHVMLTRGNWNPEWGHPLNQEDKAITLLTFSTVVLDSFRRLSIHLTPEQEEAYMHVWNVVGYLLGIRPEMLPADAADGRAEFAAIRRRLFGASEAGREVTKALVRFAQYIVPARFSMASFRRRCVS
jgi:hypothetical protein